MLAPGQYRRKYSSSALKNITNRHERHDKHGQLIAVTLSPVSGHKLPFFVKFPRISSTPRRIDELSRYEKHSEGLFNSLYYLPRKFDERDTLPIGNTCGVSTYAMVERFDLWNRMKDKEKYQLLLLAYGDVEKNVHISSQRRVTLKKENQLTTFRQDPFLINAGTYQ